MILLTNRTYTDLLEAGDGMQVTPSSTAHVKLRFNNGEIINELLDWPKRFGPYARAVEMTITAFGGDCTVEQVAIDAPLHTNGWEDLRFPAQGINPAGAADAPSVDTTLTGYPGTLLFSGSQENVIAGVAQLPHAWKRGSAIRPHIHWSKPVGSANATTWMLYYRILGFSGEVHGNLVGPVAATATLGDPTTANSMLITAFGEIDMTGQKESACLAWQIRRMGNSDADNGTARLFEFDIHYQTDKSGTVAEIPD
jgi:hypothetical protein